MTTHNVKSRQFISKDGKLVFNGTEELLDHRNCLYQSASIDTLSRNLLDREIGILKIGDEDATLVLKNNGVIKKYAIVLEEDPVWEGFNPKKVVSSNIKQVGYNVETKKLRIEFSTGGVYEYAAVDLKVHTDFLKAASVGRFFFTDIKNDFECVKIKEAN